jgi:hypothetical protein
VIAEGCVDKGHTAFGFLPFAGEFKKGVSTSDIQGSKGLLRNASTRYCLGQQLTTPITLRTESMGFANGLVLSLRLCFLVTQADTVPGDSEVVRRWQT